MKRFFVVLILLFLVPNLGSHEQDNEFFSGFVAPNILVILDSSMSMIWNMYGSFSHDLVCYGDGTTGGGTTISGHYVENPFFGMDSSDSTYNVGPGRYGTDSRLYIVKSAMVDVVNEFRGKIRWALATFKQRARTGTGDDYRAYWGPNSSNYVYPVLQWQMDMTGRASEQCFIRSGLDFSNAEGPDNESKINNMLRYIDCQVNNYNENEEIRAVTYTPIPCALKGARYHLSDIAQNDNAKWCRKYFVILITDGEPTQRIANYPNDNSGVVTDMTTDQPERQCYWEADSLLHTYVPAHGGDTAFTMQVKTYVLGIGNEGVPIMHEIARRGGTDSAYMADEPEDVVEAIRYIFSRILDQSYTFSAAEVTSIEEDFISTTYEARMYLASFFPAQDYPFWDGHLRAIRLTLGGFNLDSIPDSLIIWDAGDSLRLRNPSDRAIYGVSSDDYMWSFDNSNFSASDLGVSTDGARDTVINLVRSGSSVLDTLAYLGDIFHSSPLRIGSPTFYFRDDGFVRYRDSVMTRTPAIYAGSNTGMLHAFNDLTGRELFAVVPKNFIPELKTLRDSHRFYVDADAMAADVWFPDGAADDYKDPHEWKTVLMACQGEGGSGITCLDVTNPNSPNYLFSFEHDTMGLTTSTPVMYKVSRILVTEPVDRFLAFFGGGECPDSLWNRYDPTSTGTLKGNVIVALDIESAEGGLSYGSNYWFIKPASGDAGKMVYPFASAASMVNLNSRFDNLYDVLYIPDLAGQLWKVDVTNPDTATWEAKCIFQPPIPTAANQDMPGNTPSQPAFFAPFVEREPITGCLWVYYGTGDRSKVFKEDTDNRFYAILDTDTLDSYPLTEIDLKRVWSDGLFNLQDDFPAYKGWFIAFSDSGHTDEKVVSQAVMLMDTLTVVTFDPDVYADPCTPGNGYAREYSFHFRTGGGHGRVVGTGIPQAPRYSFKQDGTLIEAHQTFDSLWTRQLTGYGTLKRVLQWKER